MNVSSDDTELAIELLDNYLDSVFFTAGWDLGGDSQRICKVHKPQSEKNGRNKNMHSDRSTNLTNISLRATSSLTKLYHMEFVQLIGFDPSTNIWLCALSNLLEGIARSSDQMNLLVSKL